MPVVCSCCSSQRSNLLVGQNCMLLLLLQQLGEVGTTRWIMLRCWLLCCILCPCSSCCFHLEHKHFCSQTSTAWRQRAEQDRQLQAVTINHKQPLEPDNELINK
jgi:hypothetical protein